LLAANRAEAALNRVRELDPEWRPAPQLSEPQSAEGAINSYRSLAQQAEGRITVLERGGVPLGFNSREQFEDFGRSTWDGLAAAGHTDVEPFLRGSAVTGYNYRTGEPFDVGRRSDYDMALVSPTLMRRAEELGIQLRGQGSRTERLEDKDLEALGLKDLASQLDRETGRDVNFMIYRSRDALEVRGPNLPVQ
jgi:filamentous hemagglutinin